MDTETLTLTLALVGMVILLAGLLSGLIERTGLPQVAVFLALGAALGPAGLSFLNVNLQSGVLRVVATLSLALVLFTDAIAINLKEVRQHSVLTLLVLGPGTLLSAFLIGVAGWGLLGLAPAAAAILGASLASTDPVLLRSLLRRPDVPNNARLVLRLESGLNDVVLLPIVLIAAVFLDSAKLAAKSGLEWAKLLINLFLLGPGAGIVIGLLAVAALDLVRRRVGIRRDYESLYSLGVAFAAFAAAEALHGSGFLAAFAAGLTISALDVELCDCFLEYGETTAEMLLLFTFVLFGSSLIWNGLLVLDWLTLTFAALVVLIRPVAFLISLARQRLDTKSRALIAWYGPRGLSSLLLVLLVVFENLPGSERLFNLCCLVVLLSVALHGFTPMLLGIGSRQRREQEAALRRERAALAMAGQGQLQDHPLPEASPVDRASPVVEKPGRPLIELITTNGAEKDRLDEEGGPRGERISIEELRRLWSQGRPVIVLDARSERTFNEDDLIAKGAVRLNPDNVARHGRALDLPPNAWLVVYCA